jgi:hypothetical protein
MEIIESSAKSLSKKYGVDHTTVLRQCREGNIPHKKLTNGWLLIEESAFVDWLHTKYRFKDRKGHEGRRWNREELEQISQGQKPVLRSEMARRCKRCRVSQETKKNL